VAELKLYEGLIVNIPSILFAMFAGSWADQRGRKVILALPFLGNTAHFAAHFVPDFFYKLALDISGNNENTGKKRTRQRLAVLDYHYLAVCLCQLRTVPGVGL
jgi:hypothetical protein